MESVFIQVSNILKEIKAFIDVPNADTSWSGYDTAQDLIMDLNKYIKRSEESDETVIKEISLLFAPTGAFQEISIDNGWSDEFIEISERFDDIVD
ncbi:MAG: hypothetical protein VB095_06235 [Anaerovorax sp.]|nr:hypothetical protein [Anaerovorax sp.]